MMQKVVKNSCEHPLKIQKNLQFNDFSCITYFQEKLIIKPSHDNASVFTSHDFIEYCMTIRIYIAQNELAKSLTKDLKLIARPLLIRSKL